MKKVFYFIALIVILAGCTDEATKKYCEKDSDCVFGEKGDSIGCFNVKYGSPKLDIFAEYCLCDTQTNQCKDIQSDSEGVKNLG